MPLTQVHIPGVGAVSIREVQEKVEIADTRSEWDDWGEYDPAAKSMQLRRWVVELLDDAGETTIVGDLSAHGVWYGPSPGSRCENIGISLAAPWRGKGIGAVAQRLLADELHAQGVVRVEASTDVANIAEQRALAKAGFVFEGVIRGAQMRADGRHDIQGWSHLPGD
ncbi:MAG: GNAT family N-acetyltransferase [Actinomycetales bacterium]|nr:GNAT family N-acetyltransferase [Actinomycetales bacterium]